MNSTLKSQQCDDAKNEYANQLQKTNEYQVSQLEPSDGSHTVAKSCDWCKVQGIIGFVMG